MLRPDFHRLGVGGAVGRRWSAAVLGMAMLALPVDAVAADEVQAASAPTTVTFTFDDTFSDQLPALDVLHRYGMNATLYVNSPRIGLSSNYLSRTQLEGYAADGFEVGGHTLGHIDLDTASAAEARRQICDDRASLVDMGFRVTNFAYPFGSLNRTVERIVRNCGYNSARALPGLRSPGYGCPKCPTAEPIPPVDRWRIKTPATVRDSTTFERLRSYVTRVENRGGGWVTLVFHHICETNCTGDAVSISTFTQFVAWLSSRPPSTQVKTVDQVIGGTVQKPVGNPARLPAPGGESILLGSQTRALNGTNIYRATDYLVVYTPAQGARTGANEFGTEAAVVDGKVTKVDKLVGNMAIPSGGYVLSGNGHSARWLNYYAQAGTLVTLPGQPAPPSSPPPSPSPSSSASSSSASPPPPSSPLPSPWPSRGVVLFLLTAAVLITALRVRGGSRVSGRTR